MSTKPREKAHQPFEVGDRVKWNSQAGGRNREHESYLVEVARDSPRAKPRLYWPRVSALSNNLSK